MKKSGVFLLIFYSLVCNAQNIWSLQQCIAYAVKHNISVQQSELNIKMSALQVQQNKYSQYPSLNADVSNGFSLGRSIDPTSNTFINQGYYYNGLSMNSGVLLFGWFAKKYQREQGQLNMQANVEQYKQLQNDIALNIATGYLRILLAKEQVRINEAQLLTDLEQYRFTRKRVDAGALPELNAAQLQAQVMIDSASLNNSKLDVNSALLDLRAFLNMDMQVAFDIQTPDINTIPLASLLSYPNAEEIFTVAKTKRPNITSNDYKIKSAEKQIDIAKSALYPSVSLGATLGTNYASTVKSITGATYKGDEFLGNIKFGDSNIAITRPAYNYQTATVPLFKQYDNNFRQTVSLGVSVPILNGYTSKLNIARAKISLESANFTQQQEVNTLKQNVYKAYNDAQASIQKLSSAKNSEEASQIALNYAIKRYNAGMLNTQEYTTQQNTLTRAKINTALAQYDLIFKMKILDFYLGKEINL
jgi:outer membrane protein